MGGCDRDLAPARLRTGLVVALLALGGLGNAQAASAAAHSANTQFSKQLAALAQSTAARAANRTLGSTITGAAAAQFSGRLMQQYGAYLTSFQSDLLEVNQLFGKPSNSELLAALASHRRLSAAQLRLLRSLNATIMHNPAVELLVAQGRDLARSPAEISADLATVTAAAEPTVTPEPEGDEPSTDPFVRATARAITSPDVASFARRVARALSGEGALAYLKRVPPLILASLLPGEQVASYTLPAAAGAARAHHAPKASAASILSDEQSAKLEHALAYARVAAEDLSDGLAEYLVALIPGGALADLAFNIN